MCNCDEVKFASRLHRHDLYVTEQAFNIALGDYYTKAEVDALLSALQNQIDSLLADVEPIGTIKMWTNPAMIPAGWLICDGTQYTSGSGGYPALYDVIDEHFHVGESDFVVPDLRGRVPVGQDTGQAEFDVIGDSGGAKTHNLTAAENGPHFHTYRAPDNVYRVDVPYGTSPGNGTGIVRNLGGATTLTQFIGTSGSGDPHNNLQPYLTLVYIIRAV